MREALLYLLGAVALCLAPSIIFVALLWRGSRRSARRGGLADVVPIRRKPDGGYESGEFQVEVKRRPGGGWISGGKPNSRGWHRI